MRLMQFSYDIVYTAGKNLMTADTLSRDPGSAPADQEHLMEHFVSNAFVCAVTDSIPASDARLEEIRQKQCSDKICSQVMNFCVRSQAGSSEKGRQSATILVCSPRVDSSTRSTAVPEPSGDSG